MDKKGEFGFKEIIAALLVIIVLIFIIMFLANTTQLKEALLNLISFD